jgi:uncharacterized protein
MKLNEINFVIFHKNCPDGFGSAWIVNKFLKKNIEYKGIPASFDYEKISKFIKDKNLLILDLSFSSNDLKKIKKITKNFLLIDHHLTYYDEINNNKNVELDKTHSAIYLTWKKFFPNQKVPLFIKYIEDNDIRSNKYKETEAFKTALPIKYPFKNQTNFDLWNNLLKEKNVKDLINIGNKYLEYKNYLLDINTFHLGKIYKIKDKEFNKYSIILINKTVTGLNSDLADLFLKKNPKIDIVILWTLISNNNEEQNSLILRTLKENIDLSKLAKIYDGGGHSKAAHFFYKKNIKTLFK